MEVKKQEVADRVAVMAKDVQIAAARRLADAEAAARRRTSAAAAAGAPETDDNETVQPEVADENMAPEGAFVSRLSHGA